ncbi:penicillin-binding transpeptidase domain-containing protein [Fredinandcohnia sp. QZ13]|uniref:peptidoglycan D,D-transpeptidase FtsI family protein n=1 Tax=Fredinandcohnia sp. QZ13 TaxID=3073144 RepID=UPI00285341AF|nr:penicillin-binding transpeptidase domain-containing protein [Fredinandcohnia sp. QZ13]MDR4889040.1 penicillin-binding transpeptidase domain-containing protein [Fredinandcohnia sp. QZ13]
MVIKKRAIIIIIVILLTLTGLIGRLMQLQLVSTESFTNHDINLIEASVSQRTQELVIDQGRGRFIDRNKKALTHEYYPTLVLFPFLKNIEWPAEQVAEIVNVSATTLKKEIEDAKKPVIVGGDKPIELTETQMNKINNLQIPGVFAVHRQYELDHDIAEHLIGLIRENKDLFQKRYPEKTYLPQNTKLGITGLQSTFDEFLLPEGEAKLLYHVAGDGGPLFGIDVKYTAPANPYYPVAIQTTLDKDLQLLAEEILDKNGLKKGGIVLLDVESNDLLAMVSKPDINSSNPFEDGSAQNQMIMPQFPGSVFKTVIAAAAIEQQQISNDRMFNCDKDLYGEGQAEYPHGMLNFHNSFAKSCNYTFATLAQEMLQKDQDVIEQYSEMLGLLGPVGWNGDVFRFQDFKQIPNEYNGRIWTDEKDKNVQKAIAQTAIGQKDVRVTPLGIANMMATIARGGSKKEVRTVSDVLYKNGTTLFSFSKQDMEGPKIAPYTASRLQELLRGVVTSGTGQRFSDLPYQVAGKSGTAETGKKQGEVGLVNSWFAGYFPFESPKYALVVVDLEQAGSQSVANSIFYEIVKGIYQIEQEKGTKSND